VRPWEAAGPRPAGKPGGGQLLLYAVLAPLVVALGLARLATGPWYQTAVPAGARLLEGWPIAWEATYYLAHFPTFLGEAPPQLGIAPVHYRTFLNLYLATALYAWSGSAYWSIAAVDLCFWFLASAAGYHVALRLGAGPWAAALGALMTAASPLLVSNMWRHDLHTANFATMALGLWAALVLVEEHRGSWRLAVGLGLLLLLLSLTYQYQWLMLPLLVVLTAGDARLGWGRRAAVVAGAALLFLAGTLAVKAALVVAGMGPSVGYLHAVAEPDQLLGARLAGVRSPADVLALLPRWTHVRLMAQAYHPAVFVAGVIGLGLLPWRARLLGLAALAVTLLTNTLYAAPWTTMSAYPLVYAGAGTTCTALGASAARLVGALPPSGRRPARRPDRLGVWLGRGAGLALALLLMAPTNVDLIGNTWFLRQWF
jgi:hypothetical protein